MKRTLAWILAALMVLSMSACDQNNKETRGTAPRFGYRYESNGRCTVCSRT